MTKTDKPSEVSNEQVEKLAGEWYKSDLLEVGGNERLIYARVTYFRFARKALAREQSSVSEATKLATAAALESAAQLAEGKSVLATKDGLGRVSLELGSVAFILAENIRALTPADCTAALENRDAEIERKARLDQLVHTVNVHAARSNYDFQLWAKLEFEALGGKARASQPEMPTSPTGEKT